MTINLKNFLKNRSDYKATWDELAFNFESAKQAVAGHVDEDKLDRTALGSIKTLEQFVGINTSDVILEIGCGVGRVGKVLSNRCSKWIGTDISGNMLKYAAQRLKGIKNIELE